MLKTSARIKRPHWVVGLNIALALSVGTTQAFAEEITSVEQLLGITAGTSYVLTRNLDLLTEDADSSTDDIQLADSVTGASPSYYIADTFSGTFDGGGFTIFGLTKPLFNSIGGLGADTTVFDLNLEAATGGVTGQGILANGISASGSIDTVINNVHITGDVYGTGSVGGLVGDNDGGTISNSSATGVVSGDSSVGGLVGGNYWGTISNSSATGVVSGDSSVGGLVGGNYGGTISDSFATGGVSGANNIGGLVGDNYDYGEISNSYATGDVNGDYYLGGLVGESTGTISNSYATGNVIGDNTLGGLVGANNYGSITNSYATGNVNGTDYVGGLVGENSGLIANSYATGDIEYSTEDATEVGRLIGCNCLGSYIDDISRGTGDLNDELFEGLPLTANDLLEILNTGSESESPIFALDPSINDARPYLISNPPFEEEVVSVSPWINFSFLPTQVLAALNKSVGFEAAKSGLNKLDLTFLDQVRGEKSALIIGAKIFANQSLTTSFSVGSLLQLEINFAANKSLQIWVKSSNGQYVLLGNVTFDKDGNAVLPGIEFKKSGLYEFIFVNSDKKEVAQPEPVNIVSGLTVYVNQ